MAAGDAKARTAFKSAIEKLPDAYLRCRDLKHAWKVDHDFHVEPSVTEGAKVVLLRRVLKCRDCATLRVEHFIQGRYGLDKTGTYYVHPEDYHAPGVPRGVRISTIVQQESYRRALEKATGAKKGQRATAER